MKIHKVCTTLFLFLSALTCFAQNDSAKKQLGIIPKVDLFLPIGAYAANQAAFSFSLEKFIGRYISIQAAYNYFYSKTPFPADYANVDDQYMSQIIPELRFYFNEHKNHKGFYAGIYPELILKHHVQEDISSLTTNYPYQLIYNQWMFGGGMDVGFQTFIVKRIALDFLFGYGMDEVKGVKVISQENAYLRYNSLGLNTIGNYPRIAVNVGYKF